MQGLKQLFFLETQNNFITKTMDNLQQLVLSKAEKWLGAVLSFFTNIEIDTISQVVVDFVFNCFFKKYVKVYYSLCAVCGLLHHR